MRILTNKQVNKIYEELKELKKDCIKQCGSDTRAYLDDLEHIHSVAYTIGQTKGLLAVAINPYPNQSK